MSFFECCHYCVAPKRHAGCHSTCPEYIKQRKQWDELKAAEELAKRATPKMSPAQIRAIRKGKYKSKYIY